MDTDTAGLAPTNCSALRNFPLVRIFENPRVDVEYTREVLRSTSDKARANNVSFPVRVATFETRNVS